MIIDWYDSDGQTSLYTRYRDSEGNSVVRHIDSNEFRFYFYVPISELSPNKMRTLSNYEGVEVEKDTDATDMRGRPLAKIYVDSMWLILQKKIHRLFGETFEADMKITDRYLIDHVEEMPDWNPRIWWFDIEADPREDFTTVIAVSDSWSEKPVVFAWSPESAERLRKGECDIQDISRVEGYELRMYSCESDLHDGFLDYLDECDPDMLIAHALAFFDLPHLIRRLGGKVRRLSPVKRVRKIPYKGFFKSTEQPITGRLVFDTAGSADDGTGFERVWKDSGQGQLPSRKLNDIAELLGLGSKHDMDVFTGWYERFDEYVDYCVQDTLLLRKIDETYHVNEFFRSQQKLCGCAFDSTHNATRFLRTLVARRADWAIPSNPNEKVKIQGAHIPDPIPGRYADVAILDYKSLYPSIVTSHNLCWTTYRKTPDGSTKKLDNETHWDQSKKGLLPSIIDEMGDLREEYKSKMRSSSDEIERVGWNMMQLATKRVMASLYGACVNPYWGLFAPEIAETITFEGRKSIIHLLETCEKLGFHPVYGHTDSVFVQVPLEKAKFLSEKLTESARMELNAPTLTVELEAFMRYFTIASKNRYVGKVAYPEEDAGKMKVGGFELKGFSASQLSRDVQKAFFECINDGGMIHQARAAIKPFLDKVNDLEYVSCVNRISKNPEDYKVKSVNAATGALFYNKHISTDKKSNFVASDSVRWVYVEHDETKVIAFREPEDLDDYKINTKVIIEKLIISKIQPICDALGWDPYDVTGLEKPVKRRRKKK